jgi:hypothetical protein
VARAHSLSDCWPNRRIGGQPNRVLIPPSLTATRPSFSLTDEWARLSSLSSSLISSHGRRRNWMGLHTGAPSPSLRTVKKISAQLPLPIRSPFHLIPRHQWQITPLTRVEAELLDRVLSLALHPIKAYQKHASHYSASPGSPSLSVSSIMRSCPSPCTAAVAAPPPSTRSYRWNSLQP